MDTRSKIVGLAAAAEIAAGLRRQGTRLKLVAGHFDVLTPAHVDRLRALAVEGKLMAAVLDYPSALLPQRARAELAAALAMIDYVLLMDGESLEQALAEIRPDEVAREEAADRHRSRSLIEHVHRRQRA